MSRARAAVVAGFAAAVAAAASFGLTTPLVQRAGRGVGPFALAALLYAGAAVVSVLAGGRPSRVPAPLRRRALLVAVVGGALAPAALAWGLARTSGAVASLLLLLEAPFTLALARAFYKEDASRRVVTAAALVTIGGAAAALGRGGVALGSASGAAALGAGAVALAAAGWALDNTLSKPLAELDGASVVVAKGGAGAALSAAVALVLGERWPSAGAALALLALGATGYGLSLRLYLAAQRRLGAGRTASIFAAGPFAGAALAWALGEPLGTASAAGGLAMLAGVALHVTERHRHPHAHAAVTHTHAHTHDDGHHGHAHDPMPSGPHTHEHSHAAVTHDHEHMPDVHHEHTHD